MEMMFHNIRIQPNLEKRLDDFSTEHHCGYHFLKTAFEGELDTLQDGVYLAEKGSMKNQFLLKGEDVFFYRWYAENGKVACDHMENNPLLLWAIDKTLLETERRKQKE